ncbi:MAG: transglycosylase domain-containing protein [Bacteriovoracaceae bacterium]|nr:transglycosylase domain-containing protein [Bacteriovoracaceae bacterium]
MFKKKQLLFLLKTSLAILLLCAAAFGVFSYRVIDSIQLTKILDSSPPPSKRLDREDFIEQGSLVKAKDLELYLIWSKEELNKNEFLKQRGFSDQLVEEGDAIFFQEKVVLPELRQNDCLEIYCIQSKLRFSEIPSLLWKGLIGIEDYRFLDHKGVDPKSLIRALWHDLKVFRLEQGGSTLTQQLAKNLFYTNEKKFSRKIKEMIASAYIEFSLEKEQILQAYFNEVMWGSLQGIKIKGVSAAAFFYFLKKPSELDPYEVSILISLLKGPYYYSPVYKIERLKERANLVFEKLKSLNLFPDSSNPWPQETWDTWHKGIKARSEGMGFRSMYLLSKKVRERRTLGNFVFINQVEELNRDLRKRYPKSDFAIKSFKVNLKDSTMENQFEYYTKVERDLTLAIENERHQVGSTLKPIIYGLLEETGMNLNDSIETTPLTLELKSGPWAPRESHGGLPEKVLIKEALVQSLNRPVIRAVMKYGFDNFEKILVTKIPRLKLPLSEFPAQLLGSVELSLSELSAVYGEFLKRTCYGENESEVLNVLSDPLKTTIRFRVGEKLGQMRFFGKTGTSNNGFDSWFVGFDGLELLITWVGLEGPRDSEKEFKLFGSNSSFLIYKNYYQYRGKLFNEMACH